MVVHSSSPIPSKMAVPNSLALSLVIFIMATMMIHTPQVTFYVVMVLGILFPFLAKTDDWEGWFGWIKRYSVIIPTIFYTFALTHKKSAWLKILWFVLLINMVEVYISSLGHKHVKNGVLILIVAILTPIMVYSSGTIGFNNTPWVVACTLTLIYFYAVTPEVHNLAFMAIMVLLLPIAGVFFKGGRGDHWLSYRVYTLYLLLMVDSLFPQIMDKFYPKFIHLENRDDKSVSSKILLVSAGVSVVYLVGDTIRSLML
jgi:hypothetical protein